MSSHGTMNLGDQQLEAFLSELAAKQPAPGGGAAASVLAGVAAALTEMVVQYSTGKKGLREHDALHRRMLECLPSLRRSALKLAADDAAAYATLNGLQKLDADDPIRQDGWPDAVTAAIAAPRSCIDLGLQLLGHCEELIGRSNVWLRSDLAIAAIAAEAAVASAGWNVRVNLPLLDDDASRAALDETIARQVEEAAVMRRRIESRCL